MATSFDHALAAHRSVLEARASQAPGDPLETSAAVVRAWPHLARAAAYADRRLTPTGGPRIVDRIALSAAALSHSRLNRDWPGDGPANPAMSDATRQLVQAGRMANPDSADPVHAEAARVIGSALWVAAETASIAARHHAREVAFDHHNDSQPHRWVAIDAARRIAASAQLAASTLHGEPDDPSSLLQSIAAWDVQAHRALLDSRSTATLHVVAALEAAISASFGDAITAAADVGLIDQLTAERAEPALGIATTEWSRLADNAANLSFGAQAAPPQLIQTGRHLTGVLDHLVAADLVTTSTMTQGFIGHLATSVSIASTARDLCDDSELRAPAVVVNHLLRDLPDRGDAFISPVDLHRKAAVSLPSPLKRDLGDGLNRAARATDTALQAATGLEELRHRTPSALPPRDERAMSPSPRRRPQTLAPTASPAR